MTNKRRPLTPGVTAPLLTPGVTAPLLTPGVTALVVVAVLAAANVTRSAVVPSGWHFAFNVSYSVVIVAVGLAVAGLDAADLGLSRAALGSGLRWGAGAFLVVSVLAVGAALTSVGRGALDVEDAHLAVGSFLTKVGVVIPLGTVLAEELVFRGVLHALLRRRFDRLAAVGIGAVIFGLWHVFPAWRADGPLTALGTLVATGLAGVGFIWLRERSRSLVAPLLAHLATNTVPLTVGWTILR